MLHLVENMFRQLVDRAIGVIVGIAERDRYDLFVRFTPVVHRDDPDRVNVHETERQKTFRTEDENVERIAVGGERVRNESVIRRIVRRRVQDPVEDQKTGLFVKFVFLFAAFADFDHGDEVFGRDPFPVDVVPDVHEFLR